MTATADDDLACQVDVSFGGLMALWGWAVCKDAAMMITTDASASLAWTQAQPSTLQDNEYNIPSTFQQPVTSPAANSGICSTTLRRADAVAGRPGAVAASRKGSPPSSWRAARASNPGQHQPSQEFRFTLPCHIAAPAPASQFHGRAVVPVVASYVTVHIHRGPLCSPPRCDTSSSNT